MFKGHHRSLEIIRRSFDGYKLKSNKRNQLSIPKTDRLHAPKGDFVNKLCFEVTVGHLKTDGVT